MSIDFANLWSVLEGRFQLGQHSVHGSSHCRRVEENGIELAEISGGDLVVVKLFAVFHDVERESDGSDPEHGIRASELARKLHGNLFDVDDTRLEKLVYACEHHNRGFTSNDWLLLGCRSIGLASRRNMAEGRIHEH